MGVARCLGIGDGSQGKEVADSVAGALKFNSAKDGE